MLRFFLVRHGETDWNRQRKLQGHTDIPLNENGQLQAQSLVAFFEAFPVQQIFSSDLMRASQTAEIAFATKEIPRFADLREIHLGLAEGLQREEIAAKWGSDLWDKWASGLFADYSTRFPDGESRVEGIERVLRFFWSRREILTNQTTAVFFTHGLLLRSFAQWCANSEVPTFTTPNCCLFEFEWDLQSLGRNVPDFRLPFEFRPRFRQVYLPPEEALVL